MKQPEHSSAANQSGLWEISLPLTMACRDARQSLLAKSSPQRPLFASNPYHGDVLVVGVFLFACPCLIESLLQIPSLRYLEPQNKGKPDSGSQIAQIG